MIRSLLARYPLKRVVLVADRGLLSVGNIEELAKLQTQLRQDGRDVALEYILAVPTALYGDFADDLKVLSGGQAADQIWCAETKCQDNRLVVAHDPVVATRRAQASDKTIAELVAMGQQCAGMLDGQDAGKRAKGRLMSDSGTKARFYHAVKDAHMAHVIKVDLRAELFNYTIDEEKKRYLELQGGKLLLVTNTNTPAGEVVQRYKSLVDIERGFRVLKSDIEIGPVYHRLPQRIRSHALFWREGGLGSWVLFCFERGNDSLQKRYCLKERPATTGNVITRNLTPKRNNKQLGELCDTVWLNHLASVFRCECMFIMF